ncbi:MULTISPECIES: PAAR-like protein [unclassified Chryseobacterium]|uniref:PAAR-like protein n=1 Tax=unclassified Chryseobacterium TaxID=2593645 RepID=UPI0030100E9F
MAKKYVPEGAFLACDKGTSPSTLRVSNNKNTTIYSVPMASELDFLPFFNIKPMGLCTNPLKWATGASCLPTILTGWQAPKDGVKINGSRMLLEDSFCNCIFGGKINIFFDRAAAVSYGVGEGKMPSDYIKEGFDWIAEQNKKGREMRDQMLPDWMKPVTGVGDWFSDLGTGLVEGAVNGVVGLGETLYQVGQDPVGTAEALGGMVSDGWNAATEGVGNAWDWASKGDNWSNAAEGAWNWASDGQNWANAGNAAWEGTKDAAGWVAENPRKIGTTVGEFIPDAVAAVYSGGTSLAATAGKTVLKEGGEAVVEQTVKNVAEEAVEQGVKKGADDVVEAGAKRGIAETMEQLAKKEGGDIAKVITKDADELAAEAAEQAAKEAAERWAKLGYDDLGTTAPCFLAGTFVHTIDGLIPIENIQIGDIVFCYDKINNVTTKNKVTRIYNNWTDKFIKITTDKEIISATFKHLFWIEDESKWITAKELKTDMILKSLSLNNILVKKIDYQKDVELSTFNIEVENNHNYFVGNQGILVHNDNKPSKFESTVKKPTKIYEVYDPKTGKTVYVGQTDKTNVADRFKEHVAEGKKKGNHKKDWGKKYKIREVASGNWDPYEASVWEQHYIDKNGGKANLQNGRNEITKPKFDKYKNLHNPC